MEPWINTTKLISLVGGVVGDIHIEGLAVAFILSQVGDAGSVHGWLELF